MAQFAIDEVLTTGIQISGFIFDYSNRLGTAGQVLTSTTSGVMWQADSSIVDLSSLSGQIAATGSLLNNRINSLSGYSDATFATITNLATTGSTLDTKINTLSGYSNANFATILNLATTGSTLDTKINSLSGYEIQTFLSGSGTQYYVPRWNTSKQLVTGSIYDNGNVGIGTTSPAYKLDVNGTSRFANDILSSGNITIAKASAYLYLNGTNSDAELRFLANSSDRWAMGMNVGDPTENLNIYNYTTATTNFTILKTNGNVGIGSAAPNDKLDVVGRVYAYRYIAVSSDAASPAYATDTSAGMFNAGTNIIGFSIAGTEKLRIDTNGRLGIGTISPTTLLSVGGAGSTSAASGLTFGGDASANLYRISDSRIKTDGSLEAAVGIISPTITSLSGNIAATGSALDTKINSLSGYSNNSFATITNLAATGSTLDTKINTTNTNLAATGSTLDTKINTTNTNLAATGSVLDTKINTLSGYSNQTFLSGVGVANYVPRWNGAKLLVTGSIYDLGTGIGIGTTSPVSLLTVGTAGSTSAVNGISFGGDASANLFRDSNASIATDGAFYAAGRIRSADYIQFNSNLYSNAFTNPIDINVGNSAGNAWLSAIRFNQGGYVGIGTNQPSGKLHIVSSVAGETVLRADGTNGTLFSVTDDLSDSLMSVNNSAGLPVFEVFADDRVVAGQYGSGDFALVNNKVGIGTTNPTYKLHVLGDTLISGNLTNPTIIGLSGALNITGSTLDTKINSLSGYSNANFATILNLAATGSVLDTKINTTNTNLAATGSTLNARINSLSGYAGNTFLSGQGTANWTARWNGTKELITGSIYDLGTGVGIGTTQPTYKLDVAGAIGMHDEAQDIDSRFYGATFLRGWQSFSASSSEANITYTTDGTSPVGVEVLSVSSYVWARGPKIRLDKTQNYEVELWVRRQTANTAGDFYFVVSNYDNGGNLIGGDGTDWHYPIAVNPLSATWTKYTFIVGPYGGSKDHSPNARYISVGFIANYTSGTDVIYMTGFKCRPIPRYNNNNLTLFNDGRVGIGTTQPTGVLHLYGNTSSWLTSPTIVMASSSIANANIRNWRIGPADTAYGNFHIGVSDVQGGTVDTNAEAQAFTITYDQKVGIGATSPSTKLHLYEVGAADVILRLTAGNGTYDPVFQMCGPDNDLSIEGFEIWYDDDVGDVHLSTTYPNDAAAIRFHTRVGASKNTSNERLTILGNGNVGIGTASPTTLLSVGGAGSTLPASGITFGADASANLYRAGSSAIRTDGALIVGSYIRSLSYIQLLTNIYADSYTDTLNINVGNTAANNWETAIKIKPGSYVGIGTTNPTGKLHVVSSVAGETVLRADGTNGTLFSVIDDLSDSLMSVNNSAGLPVLEVFADDRIVAGQYGSGDFVIVNNKVGIGTSNPSYRLDVRGSGVNSRVGLMEFGTWPLDTTYIYLQNNSLSLIGANYGFLQSPAGETFVNAAAGQTLHFRIGNVEKWAVTSAGILQSDGAQTIRTSTGPLTLATNAGDGHIILSPNGTGNVGIGTTSPTQKLHVAGDALIASSATAGNLYFGDTSIYVRRDNSYDLSLVQAADSNSALYLVSAGSVYLNIDSNNNDTDKAFIVQNNALKAGTELFRVQENGKVGIGTTSPNAALDVNGSIHLNGNIRNVWGDNLFNVTQYPYNNSTSPDYYMGFQTEASTRIFYISNRNNDGSATDPNGGIIFRTGGTPTNRMLISYGGNVGIGTTSPTAKLDVVGTVRLSSNLLSHKTASYTTSYPGISSFGADTTDSALTYYDTGKLVANVQFRGVVWTGKHYIFTDHLNYRAYFYDNNFVQITNAYGYFFVTLPLPSGYNYPHGAAWDGRYLWCVVYAGGASKIVGYDLDTTNQTATIIAESAAITAVPYAYDIEYADGHLYLVRGGTLFIYKWNGSSIDAVSNYPGAAGTIDAQAITYDGSYLWVTQNATNIYKVGLDGTPLATITTITPNVCGWAWNGSNIVTFDYANRNIFIINTTRLRIDTQNLVLMGGRVGIGITNPGDRVQADLAAGESILANIISNAVSPSNKVGFKLSELGTASAEFSLVRDGTSYQAKLQTLNAQPLSFGTNSATRMVIDTAGNVGIGTISPTGKLTVQGNIEVNYNSTTADSFVRRTFLTAHALVNRGSNIAFGIVDGGGLAGMTVYDTAAAVGAYNSQFIAFNTHEGNVSTDERMRITQLGDVGIGTFTPLSLLTVGAAGSTTAAKGLSFGGDASANLYRSAAGALKIDGSLGIGISPVNKLVVSDSKDTSTWNSSASATLSNIQIHNYQSTINRPAVIELVQNDHSVVRLVGYKPDATSYWLSNFGISVRKADTNMHQVFTAQYDGNIGIGSTTPGAKLDVVGNINVDGSSFHRIANDSIITAPSDHGLVAYYGFDEGSSSSISDKTGRNNTSALGLTYTTTAIRGTALDGFGGNNNYVIVPDSTDFDFGTGDFAVSLWCRPNSSFTNSLNTLIEIGLYTAGILIRPHSNTLEIYLQGSFITGPTIVWAANVWYHIVVTRISSVLNVYSNGTRIASVANTSNIQVASAGYIGRSAHSVGQFFYGIIDEVKIYKGKGLDYGEVRGQYLSRGDSMLVAPIFSTTNGNVGIGTTSPTQKLDIVGSYGAPDDDGGMLKIRGPGAGPTQLNFGVSADGGYGWIQATDIAVDNDRDIILGPLGGKIGIGTVTALSLLAVGAAGSTTAANGITLGGDAVTNLYRISADILKTDANLQIVRSLELRDVFYHYSNIRFLNKAGSNWLTWFTRDTSESEAVSRLDYIRSINTTSGGNLGIGTNTPSGKLHVVSTVAGATVLRTDGTNGTLFSVVDDLSDSLMSVNNSAGLPVLEVFADDRVVAGQYGSGDFVLINNKVGLGTSNPTNKLSVIGGASIGSSTYNVAAPSNGLIVEGNVGIGTTNPVSKLHVKSSLGQDGIMIDSTTYSEVAFKLNGGTVKSYLSLSSVAGGYINGSSVNSLIIRNDSDIFMSADAGGTSAITIKNGGNVGVGSTGPSSKLDVYGGTLTVATKSSYALAVGNANTDLTFGANASNAYIQSWSSKPLYINNQGNDTIIGANVGIGNVTPSAARLHIKGNTTDPVLRVETALLEAGTSTSSKTFVSWLPIMTGSAVGDKVYIPLFK